MANSTRAPLPGTVSTLVPYCCGVNTCSSSPANCTSPNTPRDFTLVSTRFSEPTSRANSCISPRPRCTCSSRSATCLKLSPRRCSSVACSFSSTVARICSSLSSLPCCSAVRRASTALRTSPRRRSLVSDNSRSCSPCASPKRCSDCALASAWRRNATSCASRAAWLCCARVVVAVCSDCATICCSMPSCARSVSICSFWVRATSPDCASNVCWNSVSVAACSWREPRAASCTSARSTRSSCSLPARADSCSVCASTWPAEGWVRRAINHRQIVTKNTSSTDSASSANVNPSFISGLSQQAVSTSLPGDHQTSNSSRKTP